MTTIAVRQPREYAYSASAEPSSWAGAAQRERELALRAEALGSHLVGRHAGRASGPGLMNSWNGRGGVLDVAGDEGDLRPGLDQLGRALSSGS